MLVLVEGVARAEQTVVRLGFELRLFAGDQVDSVLGIGDILVAARRLVRVLALRPFSDVLK